MGMSWLYGDADRTESVATIHAALEAGVTLFDTGDFYGMGHNEMLIGEALRTAPAALREQALISVKFGALRDPDGGFSGYDGRPPAVKNFAAYSLQQLGVEHIDVYRLARVDPDVPIEETVGAIAELVQAGHVRYVGLSEAGADTIRRAAATAPIADLQIEYSLISRGIEERILPTTRKLGIGITAYGVLSRGLISGHFTRDQQLCRARAAHTYAQLREPSQERRMSRALPKRAPWCPQSHAQSLLRSQLHPLRDPRCVSIRLALHTPFECSPRRGWRLETHSVPLCRRMPPAPRPAHPRPAPPTCCCPR